MFGVDHPTGGPVWVAILIACIPAVLASVTAVVVVVLSNRKARDATEVQRQENLDQHGDSVEKLGEIKGALDVLSGQWGTTDGKVERLGERMAVVESHIGAGVGMGPHL